MAEEEGEEIVFTENPLIDYERERRLEVEATEKHKRVRALVANLASVDPVVRKEAADEFSGLPQDFVREEDLQLLIECKRDEDLGVREAAHGSLSRLPPERVVGTACRSLRSENGKVRSAAAAMLMDLGDEAYPHLSKILTNLEDEDEQLRTARCLGELGEAAVLGCLRAKLVEPWVSCWGPDVQGLRALLRTIEEAHLAGAAQLAADYLSDGNEAIRYAGLKALNILNDEGDAPHREVLAHAEAIAECLVSNSADMLGQDIAFAAGELLKDLGCAASVAASFLGRPEPAAQAWSIETLGSMGERAASHAATISQHLQSQSAHVRLEAAWALGRLGPEAGGVHVSQLAARLFDEASGVRRAAANALGLLGEAAAEHIEALTACLQDYNDDVRGAAAEALGLLGEAGATALRTHPPLDPASVRKREIDANAEVIELSVGEVAFSPDACGFGEGFVPTKQVPAPTAQDSSVVWCDRANVTPPGLVGGARYELQIIARAPGETTVSIGGRHLRCLVSSARG